MVAPGPPIMVLFGRTPCLLVILIVPCTWITIGPAVSIAVSSSSVVSTTTVGPPAPPVVPFWPKALTAAKPSARSPGCGGLGLVLGLGLALGLGLGLDVGPDVGLEVGGVLPLSTTT